MIHKLKKILGDMNISASTSTLNADVDLFDAGALDSLTLIQYVIALEDAFGIRLKNSDITYENFKSFSDMARTLQTKYLVKN